MPEIGATLREARMRARIDIAEIETATKIRAKYLRALENEEWELLPGPTFVKTFLRTYAEALGLDAKLLVDEYKVRHERLADSELRPISPRTQAGTGRGGRGPRGSLRVGGGGGGRGVRGPLTVGLLVLIVVALVVIGLLNGGGADRVPSKRPAAPTAGTSDRTTTTPGSSGTAPVRKPKRTVASLRVIPTGDVEVCLRGKGRPVALIDAVTLRRGDTSPTFRSSRLLIRLGNNSARLRVNGRTFRPAASAGPLGYLVTPRKATRLRGDQLPSCG